MYENGHGGPSLNIKLMTKLNSLGLLYDLGSSLEFDYEVQGKWALHVVN